MNTQGLKMAKDGSQDTFFAILSMLLLFSCKKGMNEIPGHTNAEIIPSNRSFHAAVFRFEEPVPFNRALIAPRGNAGAGEELTLTGSLNTDEHINYNDRGLIFTFHT